MFLAHVVLTSLSRRRFFDPSRNPLQRTNGEGTRDKAPRTSATEGCLTSFRVELFAKWSILQIGPPPAVLRFRVELLFCFLMTVL